MSSTEDMTGNNEKTNTSCRDIHTYLHSMKGVFKALLQELISVHMRIPRELCEHAMGVYRSRDADRRVGNFLVEVSLHVLFSVRVMLWICDHLFFCVKYHATTYILLMRAMASISSAG